MNAQTQSGEVMGEDVLCCSEDGKYRYLYSPDKKHRYWLEAKLSDKPGVCMFIILNPATEKGDESRRHHKTRKNCEYFADKEGCGTLWISNVFALRARRPKFIRDSSLLYVGMNNDDYIRRYAHGADRIVCAWGDGTRKAHRDRAENVASTLIEEGFSNKMYRLGERLTRNKQPFHASLRGKSPKDVNLVPYCSLL